MIVHTPTCTWYLVYTSKYEVLQVFNTTERSWAPQLTNFCLSPFESLWSRPRLPSDSEEAPFLAQMIARGYGETFRPKEPPLPHARDRVRAWVSQALLSKALLVHESPYVYCSQKVHGSPTAMSWDGHTARSSRVVAVKRSALGWFDELPVLSREVCRL